MLRSDSRVLLSRIEDFGLNLIDVWRCSGFLLEGRNMKKR